MKKEYTDLLRFAHELKNEYLDTKQPEVKALLMQSLRDLTQKREQFHQAFQDAQSAKNWLEQSKIPEEKKAFKKKKKSVSPYHTSTGGLLKRMISHSIFKKDLIAPDSIISDKPFAEQERNELKEQIKAVTEQINISAKKIEDLTERKKSRRNE